MIRLVFASLVGIFGYGAYYTFLRKRFGDNSAIPPVLGLALAVVTEVLVYELMGLVG